MLNWKNRKQTVADEFQDFTAVTRDRFGLRIVIAARRPSAMQVLL